MHHPIRRLIICSIICAKTICFCAFGSRAAGLQKIVKIPCSLRLFAPAIFFSFFGPCIVAAAGNEKRIRAAHPWSMTLRTALPMSVLARLQKQHRSSGARRDVALPHRSPLPNEAIEAAVQPSNGSTLRRMEAHLLPPLICALQPPPPAVCLLHSAFLLAAFHALSLPLLSRPSSSLAALARHGQSDVIDGRAAGGYEARITLSVRAAAAAAAASAASVAACALAARICASAISMLLRSDGCCWPVVCVVRLCLSVSLLSLSLLSLSFSFFCVFAQLRRLRSSVFFVNSRNWTLINLVHYPFKNSLPSLN